MYTCMLICGHIYYNTFVCILHVQTNKFVKCGFFIDDYIIIFTVSDTPTLSLTRLGTGLLHVQLSWTGSSPRYEVFYSLSGSDNIQSLVNTTESTHDVTSGLMQDERYEFFVVSYGNDDTPVLPSVNSSIKSVTLSK